MATEKLVKRYAAYYRGWCQAFGEHEAVEEASDISWLHSKDAVGMILAPKLKRLILKELLGTHGSRPVVELPSSCKYIQFRDMCVPLAAGGPRSGLERLVSLFRDGVDVHMFLTYHIYYPGGTRIVTFSRRKPLPIFYKEITPLRVRVA